jgi:hypothetical protein
MEFSAGRFQLLLTVCGVVAAQDIGSRESLRHLLPFLAPNSNIDLLDDAVEMGASINILSETETGLGLAASMKAKASDRAASLPFAREILLKIVKKHFPELIAFAFLDTRRVRGEIDEYVRSVLDDCRLLEMEPDDGAIDWWEGLRSLGQFSEDESKKEIGNDAEKLTVAYETSRLESLGLRSAADKVKWVAEGNDRAGFDVLSLNYGVDKSFGDQSGLQIEVKVGRKESNESFSVMLTRHEHRILAGRSMAWVLHVWLYKPGRAEFAEEPVKISRQEVEQVVPPALPMFEWETARITFALPNTSAGAR